jgi:glucose/mannose-6-phosphate isomerase
LMEKVLDDLEGLRRLDRGGMLDAVRGFPGYCRRGIEIAEAVPLGGLPEKVFEAVTFIGVGGSAIGGQLVAEWLSEESEVPMVVSRGYDLPGFVDENTLAFAVSYSGNTEETLTAFREAIRRGSSIVALTSGGALEGLSREHGLPLVPIPGGLRPRAALPYQLFAVAATLNRLGLVGSPWAEVDEAIEVLGGLRDKMVPEVPADENPAKRLALSLRGKIPFVHGPPLFEGVAYRLRTQLNENSKVPAGSGSFPELFHNAVLGCEAPDEVLEPLCLLLIRDSGEANRMALKIDRFRALFEGRVGGIVEVRARGRGRLARMLSVLYTGDFVSAYLGLLYGKDPSSMDAIDELKRV